MLIKTTVTQKMKKKEGRQGGSKRGRKEVKKGRKERVKRRKNRSKRERKMQGETDEKLVMEKRNRNNDQILWKE